MLRLVVPDTRNDLQYLPEWFSYMQRSRCRPELQYLQQMHSLVVCSTRENSNKVVSTKVQLERETKRIQLV